MAGIEHLEVHSRSYVVRWVRVDEGNTLSWSVQPHKKSINFGLVKHPGTGSTLLVPSTGEYDDGASGSQAPAVAESSKSSRSSKKEVTAQDMLAKKGFIPVQWCGKCEADKVFMGSYDVLPGHGGMYGLVFDNTFSKQTSKTATFVILTYPTGAPPQGANHLPNLQLPRAQRSEGSIGRYAMSRLEHVASSSADSLHSQQGDGRRCASRRGDSVNHHVGNLSKRRRKKGQGFARRFFSLDFSTCTLSYYYNRNSSALRGAIPLSLAAIAADERRREISIDSGAEVWHLKAPNDKEFSGWARALEKASRIARDLEPAHMPSDRPGSWLATSLPSRELQQPSTQEEEREWEQVETLVSRVVGTRDALRRLATDSTVMRGPVIPGDFLTPGSTYSNEDGRENYFVSQPEKRPFWRRKSSSSPLTPTGLHQAVASTANALPSKPSAASLTSSSVQVSKNRRKNDSGKETSFPDHCQALLADLDSVLAEFTHLINDRKRRRTPLPLSAGFASRKSMETTASANEEFFDAEDTTSGLLKIDGSEDEDEDGFHETSSISSADEAKALRTPDGSAHFFPSRPKNLSPLPLSEETKRRISVPVATVMPPSLIAFVRKNVGKDLSTISMPVSANEPLSLLQKVAEHLEYAQLLDQGARQRSPIERLLYVAAFAVSQFSSNRAKERAIRKPFNPLLGETFELVRSEKEVPGGFRLLVEKIQHRPVRLAMHADSAHWSISQCPAPGQKFWGKSAEITTDGRVRVSLHLPHGGEEFYSWNIATMFLRNVVMGEKYVEPVGDMSVTNESTGHKAIVEFVKKGMFGGKAEEVRAEIFEPDGRSTGSGLTGTWTGGLTTTGPGKTTGDEIWHVGSLVENASQTYGMTLFAAGLNEITSIERGKLPPTDSRLRPDQRMAEQGQLDEAEECKKSLEEAQRARRRETELLGVAHRPRWFVKADKAPEGEEIWKMKSGKDGYWEERAKGGWTGVEAIFDSHTE